MAVQNSENGVVLGGWALKVMGNVTIQQGRCQRSGHGLTTFSVTNFLKLFFAF